MQSYFKQMSNCLEVLNKINEQIQFLLNWETKNVLKVKNI